MDIGQAPPSGGACVGNSVCADCVICGLARVAGCDGRLVRGRRQLRRGEFLFRLGHPFQGLVAVREGMTKTYVFSDDGRVQLTGFQGPGELLGLAGIAGGVYACEARAVECCEVCELSFDRIEELVERYPALGLELLRAASREVASFQEHALLLGRLNAEERLARFMLDLARRAGRGRLVTELRLPMSRSDIGSYLGLAEETVCRLLTRFEREGLVVTGRRQIGLRDPEGLLRLAGGRSG